MVRVIADVRPMKVHPGIGLLASIAAQTLALYFALTAWPSMQALVALLLLLFVFTPLMFVFCLDLVRKFKPGVPMAGPDLRDLEVSNTPRFRLSGGFWTFLSALLSCVLAWDLAAYCIKFFETWRISSLVVVSFLALLLGKLLFSSVRIRQHWWPLIPPVLAFAIPVTLQLLEHPVQPNSRFLSDAYETALARASSSTPKPGR
jgi:hypothetical protein